MKRRLTRQHQMQRSRPRQRQHPSPRRRCLSLFLRRSPPHSIRFPCHRPPLLHPSSMTVWTTTKMNWHFPRPRRLPGLARRRPRRRAKQAQQERLQKRLQEVQPRPRRERRLEHLLRDLVKSPRQRSQRSLRSQHQQQHHHHHHGVPRAAGQQQKPGPLIH